MIFPILLTKPLPTKNNKALANNWALSAKNWKAAEIGFNMGINKSIASAILSLAKACFSASVVFSCCLNNSSPPNSSINFCLALSRAVKSWILFTSASLSLTFSFNSALSLAFSFCIAAVSCKDAAKSSRCIPKDLAIASCWIRFILPNLAAVIPWFLISRATPSKSLVKANLLASSKFNSWPVSNSASNSAEIDSSKLSNEPAISSTLLKFNPKFLALIDAWTIFFPVPEVDSLIAALALATSSVISWYLIEVLLRALLAITWPLSWLPNFLASWPVDSVNKANLLALSSDKPKNLTWDANSSVVFALTVDVTPNDLEKDSVAFCNSPPVNPFVERAIVLNCFTNCSLSPRLLFRFLLNETILSSAFVKPATILSTANAVAIFVKAPVNFLAPAVKAFPPSAAASRAESAACWNSPNTLLKPGISLVKSAKSSNILVCWFICSKLFDNFAASSADASIVFAVSFSVTNALSIKAFSSLVALNLFSSKNVIFEATRAWFCWSLLNLSSKDVCDFLFLSCSTV